MAWGTHNSTSVASFDSSWLFLQNDSWERQLHTMTPQAWALSKMVWKEAMPDFLSFYFLLFGDLELWYNLKIQSVAGKELKDKKRLCHLPWSRNKYLHFKQPNLTLLRCLHSQAFNSHHLPKILSKKVFWCAKNTVSDFVIIMNNIEKKVPDLKRNNSHIIKFTYLKGKLKCFLVYPWNVQPSPLSNFKNIYHPEKNPVP